MNWLDEYYRQTLNGALKDVSLSLQAFFRRIKNKERQFGFPRFKGKEFRNTFRYYVLFKINELYIIIPGIGSIKYFKNRLPIGKLKQLHVKKEDNHWYATVTFIETIEISMVAPTTDGMIGIDLGLSKFAYLSDGSYIDNPKYYKKDMDKLRYLSRQVSKKKKGSKNRYKARQKLAKWHRKIYNKRNDFLHKMSYDIVKYHDAIAMETLNISGMMKNRYLSRSIADASWHSFVKYLKYKSDWVGKTFVQIDQFTPSSKLCSQCGTLQEMPLKKRIYDCIHCHAIMDRDHNAAQNIKAAGLSVLKACGAVDVG